jgi:hypothetical protein
MAGCQTPEENAREEMRWAQEAYDAIKAFLEDLVITLPQRMRDAETQGLEEFTVKGGGVAVIYYLTEDGWQAYFAE